MNTRVEKTLRCPKDGRAIARIEIKDQERWLVLPPAKDGHVRSLESGLREALDLHRENRGRLVEDLGAEWHQRVTTRIENELNDLTKVHPPREFTIPSDLDLGMFDLGKDIIPTHAPCPKCHTPWQLTVQLVDRKFNGVLISKA